VTLRRRLAAAMDTPRGRAAGELERARLDCETIGYALGRTLAAYLEEPTDPIRYRHHVDALERHRLAVRRHAEAEAVYEAVARDR
jgi:hypothetical protein